MVLGFLVRVRCSCVLRTPASEGIQRNWSARPRQCVSRGLRGQKGELHLAARRALSSPFAGLQEARQCAHYCALVTTPAIKNEETLESRWQVNSGGFGWEGETRFSDHPGDLGAMSSRQRSTQVLRGLL